MALKYEPSSMWSLKEVYNTRRGEILDGKIGSKTKSVSWTKGGHGVEDGSVHWKIIKFLEQQPGHRATLQAIYAHVPAASKTTRNSHGEMRELVKQNICERVF